jgi:hypothetical protein
MKRVIGLGSAAASPSDRFAPHATAMAALVEFDTTVRHYEALEEVPSP